MPTYQYRCTSCERALEVVQKFTDASLTECPECSGQLKKVFNAVGVVFKGSGFYRTDSRSGSSSSGEKSSDSGSSTSESASSESSTSGSSESATKSESAKSESSSGGDSKTSSDSKPKAAAGSTS